MDEQESDLMDYRKIVKDHVASRRTARMQPQKSSLQVGTRSGCSLDLANIKIVEDNQFFSHEEDEDNEDYKASVFQARNKHAESNLPQDEKQMHAFVNCNYKAKNDIPQFNGENVSKYSLFWQAWDTADGKLEIMVKTPAEKLIELIHCLAGEAKQLIDDLPDAIDENYRGALKLLHDYCYDN